MIRMFGDQVLFEKSFNTSVANVFSKPRGLASSSLGWLKLDANDGGLWTRWREFESPQVNLVGEILPGATNLPSHHLKTHDMICDTSFGTSYSEESITILISLTVLR